MKRFLPLKTSMLILFYFHSGFVQKKPSFETEQKAFPRVAKAFLEKEASIVEVLAKHEIKRNDLEILVRVFKKEETFEIWARAKNAPGMVLLKEYDICSSSGRLGPKRKQGDGQVPEGFYHVDYFNPNSHFHLSFGLNYPNASDRILGEKGNLGSAIMIHGACVTIGCIPMTDEIIKEIYVLGVLAKSAGQAKIPVYIFPVRMEKTDLVELSEERRSYRQHLPFWKNLKTGYDLFEKNKAPVSFSVNAEGRYVFKP